jgi:hypothetical protein
MVKPQAPVLFVRDLGQAFESQLVRDLTEEAMAFGSGLGFVALGCLQKPQAVARAEL